METFIWKQFHLKWIKQFLKAGTCGVLPQGVIEFIYNKHIKLNT